MERRWVALDRLIDAIYPDLRRIAHRHLLRRRAGESVESAALVNEAYLKLVGAGGIRCENRVHFLALCSQIMRRILVDHARRRGFAKRGGHAVFVALDEALADLDGPKGGVGPRVRHRLRPDRSDWDKDSAKDDEENQGPHHESSRMGLVTYSRPSDYGPAAAREGRQAVRDQAAPRGPDEAAPIDGGARVHATPPVRESRHDDRHVFAGP